jgi:signal transduction histidine kinase
MAHRALTEPFRARTWAATVYGIIALPLGVLWCAIAVVGASISAGLMVVGIGFPLLGVGLLLARRIARRQRGLARKMLRLPIPEPERTPLAGPWWRRPFRAVGDAGSWSDLGAMVVALPMGLIAFVGTVVAWVSGPGALSMFIWWWALPDTGFLYQADGLTAVLECILVAAAGVGLFFAAPWVVRAVTHLHANALAAVTGTSRAHVLEAEVDHLSGSRDAAVAAAAAERRRIERALHDGAQVRLVHLAMDLDRARERFDDDPEGARAILDQAHADAKLALGELRDLARGVHPQVLVDRGLDAALSAVAARSPVPVEVTVELSRRPPSTVEEAAYFVVGEALANVARHSQATRARVAIQERGAMLVIEVVDDGQGGADPSRGTGLVGLGDRLRALDGELVVVSPTGGPTALRATLPFDGARSPHGAPPAPSAGPATPAAGPPPPTGGWVPTSAPAPAGAPPVGPPPAPWNAHAGGPAAG